MNEPGDVVMVNGPTTGEDLLQELGIRVVAANAPQVPLVLVNGHEIPPDSVIRITDADRHYEIRVEDGALVVRCEPDDLCVIPRSVREVMIGQVVL